MKRLSATALALALALGAGGCTDNHATVQIFAICGPPSDAATCTTTGACETLLAGRPWVVTQYIAGPPIVYNSLDLYVQVDNQLPDNSDPTAGRVNTNNAVIERILFSFQIQDYTVGGIPPVVAVPVLDYPFAQTVPTASSTTPLVPIIPREIMTGLDGLLSGDDDGYALVLADVAFAGHLEDGTNFETAAHTFAVEVYYGFAVLPDCPKAGEDVVAICPHAGQTASIACEAP